jgi:two-component system, NtrC family, response regulator GlrR
MAVESFKRDYLASSLDLAGGNVSLAAKLAGKERRSLGKLLKKCGLGNPPRKKHRDLDDRFHV